MGHLHISMRPVQEPTLTKALSQTTSTTPARLSDFATMQPSLRTDTPVPRMAASLTSTSQAPAPELFRERSAAESIGKAPWPARTSTQTTLTMPMCATPTARSRYSMLPMLAPLPVREQSPATSIGTAALLAGISIPAMRITASCARRMARSRNSMHRAQVSMPGTARGVMPSMTTIGSPGGSGTTTASITASCEPRKRDTSRPCKTMEGKMKTTRLFSALLLTALTAAPALSAPHQPQLRGRLAPFALPSLAEIRNALQHASHHAKRDNAQYTIIDAPGADQGYGQGTFAFALNSSGAAAGWYEDWLGKAHGFERASDGTYKTVDVGKTLTVAYGINDKGAVAGNYADLKTNRCPGFLRTPKGKTKKFEPPDAQTGCGEYIGDVNNNTSISGDYYGTDGHIHGFLRTKNGTITEFSVPGATNTYSWWMNDNDAIASPYTDGNGDHGYIRAVDGTFTTFNGPGGAERGN